MTAPAPSGPARLRPVLHSVYSQTGHGGFAKKFHQTMSLQRLPCHLEQTRSPSRGLQSPHFCLHPLSCSLISRVPSKVPATCSLHHAARATPCTRKVLPGPPHARSLPPARCHPHVTMSARPSLMAACTTAALLRRLLFARPCCFLPSALSHLTNDACPCSPHHQMTDTAPPASHSVTSHQPQEISRVGKR